MWNKHYMQSIKEICPKKKVPKAGIDLIVKPPHVERARLNLGPFCPKGPYTTNTESVVAIHTTTCSTAFSSAGKTNTVLLLALTVFAFTTAQRCGRFLRCKQCNRITLDWSSLFSLLFFRNSRAFFRSGRSSRLKHSSQQHKGVHSRPARKHSQYLAITHPPHTHTVSNSVPSDRSSEWWCLRRYWREANHQNDPPPERKTLHHCVLMWGTLAEVACLVHAQKKNASSRNDPSSGDHEKRSSSARF